MRPYRYGADICPNCGKRPKAPGRVYCAECRLEREHEYRRQRREKTSSEFQALMREARECRESVKHLRKMGEVGRARE